jgi:glycosyltransferase involved in cell wall biosynthesis
MPGPAISILMPSYNAGDFLVEAVQSVVGQLREDDELLIQDGGSTDGSLDKLREAIGDVPQVKVVSAKDGGQADALNQALARAANPVVGWLNADDLYYPGVLEAARGGWLEDPDADLVYGSFTLYDLDGNILRACHPRPLTRTNLMRTPQIFTGAMFIRTEALRTVGGLDASLYFCMDLDLVARLLALGREPILVPETLGGFRWYAESKTGAMDFGVVREGLDVRRRYAEGPAEVAAAFVFSGTQAVWHAALPLRRSTWFSRLNALRRRVQRGAAAGAHRTS